MPDPDAGLAALRGVLNPDGAMQLMMYAPYGRAGIYMLRDFCRRLDIQAADQEIHDLIAALTMLSRGHPLEKEMQLLDAIDGRHAIGEIATDGGDLKTARALFERLWWYDQVVFDASRQA